MSKYYDIGAHPMRIEEAFVRYFSYALEHREVFHFMWEECAVLGLGLRSELFENRCFVVEEAGAPDIRSSYGDVNISTYHVWRFTPDFHDVADLGLEFKRCAEAEVAARSFSD